MEPLLLPNSGSEFGLQVPQALDDFEITEILAQMEAINSPSLGLADVASSVGLPLASDGMTEASAIRSRFSPIGT
jgi:hypothetical protein